MTSVPHDPAMPGQHPAICPHAIQAALGSTFITADEFAKLARLSRRQIDRLRKNRPAGFPREYELGSGTSKYRSCPRFKRAEVDRWLDSRALW